MAAESSLPLNPLSAPSRLCGDIGPGAYAQNPAKTQPFTSQDSGSHNSTLSADQSKIENPKPKIAEPSDAEDDFGGESLPVNPYEPTRDWLERQGINVSKIPEGARFITAG